MASPCIYREPSFYKEECYKMLPKEAQEVIGDKDIEEIITKKGALLDKIATESSSGLFGVDYDEVGMKAVIYGYKEKLQKVENGVKTFIPKDLNDKLDKELMEMRLSERTVKAWAKKVKDSLVSEKMIEKVDEATKSSVEVQTNEEESKDTILTSEKIQNTQIFSNYKAAGEVFSNQELPVDEIITQEGLEAIILYTTEKSDIDRVTSLYENVFYETNVNERPVLRINPSNAEVKNIIGNHNKIGVIRGKNNPGRVIDNLYQNVQIEQTAGSTNSKDFIENRDMLLFQHKINHLYIQNNEEGLIKEIVMDRVLTDLRDEYEKIPEAEKNKFKGRMIKKLIDNFDYISSLISVNEDYEGSDLNEYDTQQEEDVLYGESHSTSNMPKDKILVALLSSFETGKVDELGTPIYYEPGVINNILIETISGSEDSDKMVARLTKPKNVAKHPWFTILAKNIEKDGSKRLKSILFTKYANLYKSNYISISGHRTIDEGTSYATTSINLGYVSDETKSKFNGVNFNEIENVIKSLRNVNSVNDLNEAELNDARNAGMSDEDIWNAIQNDLMTIDSVTGYDFKDTKLRAFLGYIGIETDPEEHDFSRLTEDEIRFLKDNVAKIYRLAYRDYGEIPQPTLMMKDYKSLYENILDLLNSITQQKTESIVRTAGQAKFVYADKNYVDKVVDNLHTDRENFITNEFLNYELFTNKSGQDYKKAAEGLYSSLLKDLALSEDTNWFRVQAFFVMKDKDKDGKKYGDLSPEELHEINRQIFYKEEIQNRQAAKQGNKEYVLVHSPIYADKGQLHYYRVPKIGLTSKKELPLTVQDLENGNLEELKEPEFLTAIKKLIRLEISRITTAKERAKLIAEGRLEPIDVYDTVGDKKGRAEQFCFQPMLNTYGTKQDKDGKEVKVSLYEMMQDIENENIKDEEKEKKKEELLHLASCSVVRQILYNDCKNVKKVRKKDGTEVHPFKSMLKSLREKDYAQWNKQIDWFKAKDIIRDEENKFRGYLSDEQETEYSSLEYALNSYIRQADIKQLTISDEALYKNEVDVQKRYAQVQAGYQRPDTKSKYGRDWMRTIYLKDDYMSLSEDELASMKAFLNQAREALNLNIDVDSIVDSFRKNNVADAQCYRTLTSYRSVRDMFGLWSVNDEKLYQKIRNNEPLTKDDYNQVWQTLKPFLYTQQDVEWIDEDGVIRHNKVGYQYKNSENVLFNMYMLFSKDKNKRSKLGELNRFMEQYNIDTAQFESAVKVGREGLIDLNNAEPDDVFEYLKEKTGVEKEQDQKCKSGMSGNPHVIHEIPYKEYGIKTSTPPHMFDTEQQLGSQLKKLLQGDIPNDAKIYLDMKGLFTKDGAKFVSNEDFKIQLFGDDIILKAEEDRLYLDKENYLKLFNGLMSDIMLDGFNEVQDIFNDKEKLSDALQELMAGSPKYDFDIKQALKIGKDGKFIVDPKSPVIKDKITVLMTSILKNRINKQLTRGGTAIQMACWGGEDVMHEDGTYGPLKIVKNPDGTIKYMECLMPAYSRQFIESMLNKDGVLDPKKCKDENLLKALCYRVPTEDIYSMIPLKIVGFTPLQFGTNIMLPQEITTLTGSDFDVDKMYLFFPEFKMERRWTYSKELYLKYFHEYFHNIINERITSGKPISKDEKVKLASDFYRQFINERIESNEPISKEKDKYFYEDAKEKAAKKMAYSLFKKSNEYKQAKDDATQAINDEIEKRLKEREYETISEKDWYWDIKSDSATVKQYEKRSQEILSKEEAEKIEKEIINRAFNEWGEKNGLYIERPRFVKFDKSKDISENSVEAKRNLLLSLMRGAISSPYNLTKEQNPGGFDYLKELANEVNKDIKIPMNLTEAQYLNFFNLNMTGKKLIGIYANHNVSHALCQGTGLALNEGIIINGKRYKSLSEIYDSDRRRISRNIAEFLAASVDNAKDPVLAKLWQNDHTASTTCFLLRLGVPPKKIVELFKNFNSSNKKEFDDFMKYGPNAFKKFAMDYNPNNDIKEPSNFFPFLGYYANTIQNLETINLMIKADSTNGAMYDLSDIIDKTIKLQNLRGDKNLVGVENVLPEYDEDPDILSKSKKEIIDDMKKTDNKISSYKVAYYLTYCNFRQYFGDIIDRTILDNAISFGKQLPMFTDDNIKDYITKYTKEQLKYLDYFKPQLIRQSDGSYKVLSTNDIINRTLSEIPQRYSYYKSKYPNNMFIKMLTLAENNDGTQYLMINNIADMRFDTVNEVKAAFNDLYNDFESMQDAIDLIHYTLCINGFGYDPRSYISMIPIKTLAQQNGMENLYKFFEIDNIEKFEDDFILENKLFEQISPERLGFKDKKSIPSTLELKNISSKIIKINGNRFVSDRYWKKMYENEDGTSYYQEVEIEANEDGELEFVHTDVLTDSQKDIYNILDKEIISPDVSENREEVISNIVESIINTYQKNGRDISDIDKKAIIETLSDTNNIGRFFNLNADPMNIYQPIAIDFC